MPLSQLADIRVRSGESTVTRENGQRNLTIRIDNRDRELTSYLEDAQKKIDAQVHFDRNKIRLEWGGQFENQRRAEARLLVILGLVMGMMLIFLTVGLKSFRQALLILGVVPLATLGGLISLHITGQNLNVASGVGFIALFGVAVQNGIIMVSNLNRMRKSGLDLHEAIMQGATERLRPVLMTATVATLGMLPAAIQPASAATCSAASRPWWSAAWRFPPYSRCSSCPRCITSSSTGPSGATARRGGANELAPRNRAGRRACLGAHRLRRRAELPAAHAAGGFRLWNGAVSRRDTMRPRGPPATPSNSSPEWISRANGGRCSSRRSSIC